MGLKQTLIVVMNYNGWCLYEKKVVLFETFCIEFSNTN
jgi:hypothetical protein